MSKENELFQSLKERRMEIGKRKQSELEKRKSLNMQMVEATQYYGDLVKFVLEELKEAAYPNCTIKEPYDHSFSWSFWDENQYSFYDINKHKKTIIDDLKKAGYQTYKRWSVVDKENEWNEKVSVDIGLINPYTVGFICIRFGSDFGQKPKIGFSGLSREELTQVLLKIHSEEKIDNVNELRSLEETKSAKYDHHICLPLSVIKRTRIESSNLASIGYDSLKKVLEVEFNNGTVYQYFGVPQHIYVQLMKAESHGKYFYDAIRLQFPYKRIDYEPTQSYTSIKNDENHNDDSDDSDDIDYSYEYDDYDPDD